MGGKICLKLWSDMGGKYFLHIEVSVWQLRVPKGYTMNKWMWISAGTP